ncbi:unnamed protein product [Sphagnum tenellum]
MPYVDAVPLERLDDGLGHGDVLRAADVGVEEGDLPPVEVEEEGGGGLGHEGGGGTGAREGGVQQLY